jgi:hypothetical protein
VTCGEQIKAYENWTQPRQDAVKCFYLLAEIGTVLGHETEKSRTAASPKFVFREAGTQVLLLKCHALLCSTLSAAV